MDMKESKQDYFLKLYKPIHDRFERFCRARVYGGMEFRGVLVIHWHQNSHSFLETMKISSFYLDNKMKFEAAYEKLCEP